MNSDKQTVLVIEDDEVILSALISALDTEGYDAIGARNGVEALIQLDLRPIQVVITDIFMPEMDGIETILNLRKMFPNTKIIAISGGGSSQAIDYLPVSQRFGASRTLKKPFLLDQMLLTVREVLEETPAPTLY